MESKKCIKCKNVINADNKQCPICGALQDGAQASCSEAKKGKNGVATLLTVLAYSIFVIGFIAGCVNANVETGHYYTTNEFLIEIAMIYWSAALISGALMLGFAEIIKLLTCISEKNARG